MGRRFNKLDVAWYLTGKKKPFIYTTIATSDIIEDMAKLYGNGFIELIPLEKLQYFPDAVEVVKKIQDDFQTYNNPRKFKKYRPFKIGSSEKYKHRWFDFITIPTLRAKLHRIFSRYELYTKPINNKTLLFDEINLMNIPKSTKNFLYDTYNAYYSDCHSLMVEHNKNLTKKWLNELKILYNETSG